MKQDSVNVIRAAIFGTLLGLIGVFVLETVSNEHAESGRQLGQPPQIKHQDLSNERSR